MEWEKNAHTVERDGKKSNIVVWKRSRRKNPFPILSFKKKKKKLKATKNSSSALI